MSKDHEFPAEPVPAVGAIVFRGSQVLLVRRGAPPSPGVWSIPGGALETGETVEEAVVRETREETGVVVRPLSVISVSDYIAREGDRVRWHYVLVDLLCAYVRGEPFPASDASHARFVEIRELMELDLAPDALQVIERAARERRPEAQGGP
jgi:8-oxo-dGTP diphosphatase